MMDAKVNVAKALVKAIPELTAGQLYWLDRVIRVFSAGHKFDLRQSDLFDETTLQNFGDAVRIHHAFSAEPFTKDKFEYVLVKVLELGGHKASLASKGNPGHDVTVGDTRLSLKTQADRGIRSDVLWISKFMELGKGRWGDRLSDLDGLRSQFLAHMKNYDRIFSLRALERKPQWRYELVEIPKSILQRAREGELQLMSESKQSPKPGYCHVRGQDGSTMFDLYFDGGTERKLQVKNLDKKLCTVHATLHFIIPLG